MKFSIRDLAFAVAIFGLGLAFYLHTISTRRQIESFKQSTRHEMMSFEFETKLSEFKESFRTGDYECNFTNTSYSRNQRTGEYELEFALSRRDGKLMTGREFRDLLRPISEGYRIDAEKHWDVTTSWEPESTIDNMKQESWGIEFVIQYGF